MKTSSAAAVRRVMVSRVVCAREEAVSVLMRVRISQGMSSCAATNPSMVSVVSAMDRK